MTYYKVLDENGAAFHGGAGVWPLPQNGEPGEWVEVEGELIPCENGLHLCRERDLIAWLGPFRQHLHAEGADEARGLEGLVPPGGPFEQRAADGLGHAPVEVVDEGLDRLGALGGGVLLLETVAPPTPGR